MISPVILAALVFIATLALCVSAAYLLVVLPLSKHRLKVRVTAVPQARITATDANAGIMRRGKLSDIPALSQFLAELPLIAKIEFFLEQAAIRMNVASFLMTSVGGAFAAWMISTLMRAGYFLGPVFAIGGAAAPFVVASYKRQRRFHKFEEQFPNAIDLLSRAVRAGHAFTTAFSLIGEEMVDPVAEEFRVAFRQQNLGLPLREALDNLAIRVPLPDVQLFVTALQIQRESGGNLAEILDNLSAVIRERFKILREVNTITAEARLSMYVLIAMPFAAAMLMYMANAEYISPLFTDSLGREMLITAGIMQLAGYLIIRKIVKVKV